MRRTPTESAELGDKLPDGRRGGIERRLLVSSQLDLEDALHPARTEDDRDADEQVLGPEFALEQHGARQNALAIEQDRLDHLEGRCCGGVVGRAGLEQGNDLRAAVAVRSVSAATRSGLSSSVIGTPATVE